MKWKSCIQLLSLSILTASQADALSVVAIKSADTPLYREAVQGLSETLLQHTDYPLTVVESSQQLAQLKQNIDLLVTIGTEATENIFSTRTRYPLLAILIPQESYWGLQQRYPESTAQAQIITIDQPAERKAWVIRKTLPHIETLGIVTADNDTATQEIIEIFKQSHFHVYQKILDKEKNIVSVFKDVAANSDAILALPDTAIYNRHTIKPILISTYRHDTPLIGYSSALTQAGAMLSIYSPPYYIGKQAAEIISASPLQKTVVHHLPKYFVIEINPHVARSLKIHITHQEWFGKIQTDRQ